MEKRVGEGAGVSARVRGGGLVETEGELRQVFRCAGSVLRGLQGGWGRLGGGGRRKAQMLRVDSWHLIGRAQASVRMCRECFERGGARGRRKTQMLRVHSWHLIDDQHEELILSTRMKRGERVGNLCGGEW